jgi:hypothetical protein
MKGKRSQVQGSASPLAAKVAGLIEKQTYP